MLRGKVLLSFSFSKGHLSLEGRKADGNYRRNCPDSSEVEHLHGKQAVEGSIPFLGRKTLTAVYTEEN